MLVDENRKEGDEAGRRKEGGWVVVKVIECLGE